MKPVPNIGLLVLGVFALGMLVGIIIGIAIAS